MTARLASVCIVLSLAASFAMAQPDPLPSWNDTGPKQALVALTGSTK